MHLRSILVFLFAAMALADPAAAQGPRPELLVYCGITMVRPMGEIAQLFEARENVKVTMAQGGSEDLYQSAKKRGGDLYLPGEPSYRQKHLAEGLLGDYVTVGYNQMAMMVQKGNPKQVKPDPRELLRRDLTVILGNAESGSVGNESKEILDRLGIYPKVVRTAAFLASDSRSLSKAMRQHDADLTMNWRATGYAPDNLAALEMVDLDPKLAKPQALMLMRLTSSHQTELARRFMALAAGPEGQALFRKHGFLEVKGQR
ncbi:MAG: substrate-binding domain-containing protein [Sterolibacteriaceae bacterium]|nr:substrate-binding domain-containing protein [Candidatus Methylophosphatis haderslevensis]